MKINLGAINKNDFNVSEREHPEIGPVVLIGPSFDKHRWALDELHLRSLLCTPDGTIISSGFPKFTNYGENEEFDRLTDELILKSQSGQSQVWHTEKIDGSLIIRSVFDPYGPNKKVFLRTRGTHQLADDFREPVMSLIREKYPKILDPEIFYWGLSLVFEYTAPTNQIILNYAEPELTLLGVISHHPASEGLPHVVGDPDQLRVFAATLGCPCIKFHDFSGPLDEIIEKVSGWNDSEGIVVRMSDVPDDQLPTGEWSSAKGRWPIIHHMAKIKAARYIRLHSLKFFMTAEKIKQFCWYKGIDSQELLRDAMFAIGIDWEAVQFILPEFLKYIEHKDQIAEKSKAVLAKVDQQGIGALPTRKRMALALKELTADEPEFFSLAMSYVLGETEKVQRRIDAMTLGITVNGLENFYQQAKDLTEVFENGRSTDQE